MSLFTLSSSKIRVLFLFVGIACTLVIITCINLTFLNSNSSIKNLDNTFLYKNTTDPIHSSSQPSNLRHKSNGHIAVHPTAQPPNLRTKSEGKAGYVLPLAYGGHQARGVSGITSIQCWIKSFDLPVHIVEPLVSASQFLGLPKDRWIKFNDIFDINLFNKLTHVENRFAQLVTWDDFLQKAPRNIIYVKRDASAPSQVKVEWEAQPQPKDTNHSNCQKIATLQYLHDRGFCVVKVVNQHHRQLTADDLYQVIFNNWRPEEVTLIITGWTPNFLVLNHKVQSPLSCQGLHKQEDQPIFFPNKQLIQAAQKYENMFLKPNTSIAVMLRSEHFLISLGRLRNITMLSQATIVALNKLVTITRKLKAKFPHGKIFVTADVGRYGSYTWGNTMNRLGNRDRELNSFILEAIKDTVTALYDNSWTFEEWERSFGRATGGIENQSYISVLQKSIASRARCLLLFGGGGFELIALHEYLHHYPDPSEQCWKFLGVRTNFKAAHPQLFTNYLGIQIGDFD